MERRLGERSPRIGETAALLTVKGRRDSGRFLLEGPTLLREAVRSGVTPHEIYATKAAYDAEPLAAKLAKQGVPLFIVSERAAKRLSDVRTPQGIFAVASTASCALPAMFERSGIVIVLAGISDPGNAGTLLRCADAFRAAGAIFSPEGVGPYHPKVVRAAMGSIFRVPVAVAGPSETSRAASEAGRPVFGLDAAGGSRLANMPLDAVLVVGHERHGLELAWAAVCAEILSIPMAPQTESLNAAIAGAIALYEANRGKLA